jgi:hypothetical protein
MPYIDLPIPVNTSEDIQDAVAAMLAAGTGISLNYNDPADTLTITNTIVKGSFGVSLDGSGNEITTGSKGFIIIPFSGTITGWKIVSSDTGNIVFDLKKSTFAGFPPSSSICGGNKPTMTGASTASGSISGWTTSVSEGDVFEFIVDSVSGINDALLTIEITKGT